MDITQCILCEKMEEKWQQFKLPEELASNPILQQYLKNIKEKSHTDVHVKLKEYEEELLAQQNARRARAASIRGIDIIPGAPDIQIGREEDD